MSLSKLCARIRGLQLSLLDILKTAGKVTHYCDIFNLVHRTLHKVVCHRRRIFSVNTRGCVMGDLCCVGDVVGVGSEVGVQHRSFFSFLLRRRRPKTKIMIIFNFVGDWHLFLCLISPMYQPVNNIDIFFTCR